MASNEIKTKTFVYLNAKKEKPMKYTTSVETIKSLRKKLYGNPETLTIKSLFCLFHTLTLSLSLSHSFFVYKIKIKQTLGIILF